MPTLGQRNLTEGRRPVAQVHAACGVGLDLGVLSLAVALRSRDLVW